jgi:sterol desaturase/sphingolipid hydroxylase (fatty acid hydroxylase superfamily)
MIIDDYLNNFWNYLLDNYSEAAVITFIPYSTLFSTYFLISFFFMFIDSLQHPFFFKYKLQHRLPSPQLMKNCFKVLFFTFFVVILPSYYFSFQYLVTTFGFSVSRELPKFTKILTQIILFLIVEDFSHYWLHRFLHLQFIYPYIHYQHHEFSTPTSAATNYAHPAEVSILGFCTLLGPILLKPHIFVFLVWMHIRQFTALETHCGYDFPWSPNNIFPFICGGAKHHDYHHVYYKKNFASNFIIWDKVFGTEGENWEKSYDFNNKAKSE